MSLPTLLKKRKARTLIRPVSFSGKGIHYGKTSCVTCHPQSSGGVVFQRIDLPHQPLIQASVDKVVSTQRCTVLGEKEASVATVEHLLAAFKAYGVDHVKVEIEGPEVPIIDGSSLKWAQLIQDNLQALDSEIPLFSLNEPLYYQQGQQIAVALPSEAFQVSYTLSYPQHPLLKSQFHTYHQAKDSFIQDLAPCRTFCLYEEVEALLKGGKIQGGSLENAVVIKGQEVLAKGGLRFENEMCRHKILDFIGDFSLCQWELQAHFILLGSGHSSNIALTKKLSTLFRPELSYAC